MKRRGANPWGDVTPRKPKVGAGREALKRRAKARGGRERKASAEAARRGLRRAGANRRRMRNPFRSASGEVRRFAGLFQQQFVARKRLRHLLIAIGAVWMLWTFGIGDGSLTRLWMVKHKNARLEARIAELTAQHAALKEEVEALEDPRNDEALELVARDDHALVKDGEVLVRFYGKD